MWDDQPWDNDRAADWFARLIGDAGFAASVRQTLQQVLDADYIDDEQYLLRAACYCLIQFGHVYVWPIDSLDSDLRLGMAAIKRVQQEIDDNRMLELLNADFSQLEARASKLMN